MANKENDKTEIILPDSKVPKILVGQKAIVTGANSGIGKGTAIELAKAGADVVVNYIVNDEAAFEIVDEIKKIGANSFAFKADVSNENDVIEMFKKTINEFGTVDILVNNAGLQRDAPIDEMTLEQWNKVISVNLTGQFLCAREAVKEFKEEVYEKKFLLQLVK